MIISAKETSKLIFEFIYEYQHMKRVLLLLFAFVIIGNLPLQAQPDDMPRAENFKNWSDWIPILDNNQNQVYVSISIAPLTTGLQRNDKPWFNYKIVNRYSEPISGRVQYKYVATDGIERTMSCTIQCLEPQEQYFNWYHSQMNVSKVLEFRFVEFLPCQPNSKLIGYHADDSTAFQLYNAIKTEQSRKASILGSSNDAAKGGLIKDNSDAVILYKGRSEDKVHLLLSKVKGWTTNSGLQVRDGMPPQLTVNNGCQRDQYVYSAVLFSWAAESYYRIGEQAKAADAAAKADSVLRMADMLCSNGGLHVQSGSCATENIYPCLGSGSQGAPQGTAPNRANVPENQGGANMRASANPAAVGSQEMKLLSELLPVLSASSGGDYTSAARSLSNFTDNLAASVQNDSTASGLEKVVLKLAAINVKMQSNEMAGLGVGSSLRSPAATLSGSGSLVSGTSVSSSDFSHMNSFQQQEYLREKLTPVVDALFDQKENADGRTAAQQAQWDADDQHLKVLNRQFRERFGYSLNDFFDAIVDFDNPKLDLILQSGFPVDTPLYNHQVYHDVYYNDFNAPRPIVLAAKYGNEYAIKKLIQRGVDINKNEGGRFCWIDRPLDVACYFDRYGAVRCLLDNGASLENRVAKGESVFKVRLRELRDMRLFDILALLQQYAKGTLKY